MAISHPFFCYTITITVLVLPVFAQIRTPCTNPLLASFTPCFNFITNSTGSGTSPTSDCCNALKTIMSGGTDCFCLIATGGVPFQLPINRTLAISLPRACNMPGVPLQCKAASAAPIPAPGPGALSPNLSPEASTPLSPTGSDLPEPVSPAAAPEADATPALTPPSTTGPNTGSRPELTPSAAVRPAALNFLLSLLLAALAAAVLKHSY